MALYRKKPVVIEAHQWFVNGDHPEDGSTPYTNSIGEEHLTEGKVVRYFRCPDIKGTRLCEHCNETMHDHGWIDILESGHVVCPGDWVITGVKGEPAERLLADEGYPCKPDIFEATYDLVETKLKRG